MGIDEECFFSISKIFSQKGGHRPLLAFFQVGCRIVRAGRLVKIFLLVKS